MASSFASVQNASKIIVFTRQLFYNFGTSQPAFTLKPCFFQISHMSQYPPVYLDPVVQKDELIKGLPEDDLRRHRPVKAPSTDISMSPLFYDPMLQKFTNMMMKGGNKERVREITSKVTNYINPLTTVDVTSMSLVPHGTDDVDLLENLKHIQVARWNKATSLKEKAEIECNPVTVFKAAIENCKPLLMMTKVVKAGIAYRVPVCARPEEQTFRAMQWIIESCRDKERRIPMEEKLTLEIMDAYNHQGKAIRKKQEIHKMCESNRAYAHLR